MLRDRRLGRLWRLRWPEEALPAYTLLHVHSMLENEPPMHTRLRRLVAAAFGRGQVERLRSRIAAVAAGLADAVAEAGSDGSAVDLLPLYAEPLPVAVIAELLGVPEPDRGLLRPWSNAIVKIYEYGRDGGAAGRRRAGRGGVRGLRPGAARRAPPPAGTDLLSELVAIRDTDGRPAEPRTSWSPPRVLLQMAGHEATVNVVGNGVLALLRWPAELARLRADPDLARTAVEELIRFDSPLQLFERTATSDAAVGGVRIPAGQKVAALLGAANRDPAVFADPDRLDVGRADNPHIGFGAGHPLLPRRPAGPGRAAGLAGHPARPLPPPRPGRRARPASRVRHPRPVPPPGDGVTSRGPITVANPGTRVGCRSWFPGWQT